MNLLRGNNPEEMINEMASIIAEGEYTIRKHIDPDQLDEAIELATKGISASNDVIMSQPSQIDIRKSKMGLAVAETCIQMMTIGASALAMAKPEPLDTLETFDTPADHLRACADAFEANPAIAEGFKKARDDFRMKMNLKHKTESNRELNHLADSLHELEGLSFEDFQRETQ